MVEGAAPSGIAEAELLGPAVAAGDQRKRRPGEIGLVVGADRQEPPFAESRRAQVRRWPGTLGPPADEGRAQLRPIGGDGDEALSLPALRGPRPTHHREPHCEAVDERGGRRRPGQPKRGELDGSARSEEGRGLHRAIGVRFRAEELDPIRRWRRQRRGLAQRTGQGARAHFADVIGLTLAFGAAAQRRGLRGVLDGAKPVLGVGSARDQRHRQQRCAHCGVLQAWSRRLK